MNTATTPDFDLEYRESTENASAPGTSAGNETPIPDKYQNKSVDDLIRMHQEAEKKASRLANEVSETRRLADALLDLKKTNVTVPEKKEVKPVTTDDLFSDPNAAIKRTIDSSEVATKLEFTEKKVQALEASLGHKQFEAAYPNYKQDIEDPDFVEWVKKNPARVQLAVAADQRNYDAARALWDMWDEHKEVTGGAKAADRDRDRQGRFIAARTIKNSATDSVDEKAKPVYSRVKLMELRTKAASGDPAARAKYENPEFQKEMTIAYAEGRVR